MAIFTIESNSNLSSVASKCIVTAKIITKLNNQEKLSLKETLLVFNLITKEDINEETYTSIVDSSESIPFSDFLAKLNENNNNLCSVFCNSALCKSIKTFNSSNPTVLKDYNSQDYTETYVKDEFVKYYKSDLMFHQDLKRFYFYEHGLWNEFEQNILEGRISSLMEFIVDDERKITQANANKVYKRLQTVDSLIFKKDFNTNKFLLNLKNGVYDLRNKKFLSHSPSYYHNYQFPFEYHPNADCPLFKEKLAEIFPNDQESIDFLRSWMLYLMIRSYEHQKILFMIGEKGRNGKSLIAELITEMLSKALVTNQNIEELSSNRNYSKVQLESKLLNIASETSYEALETNILKNLSGGDTISAREIYKPQVKFTNYARLVVIGNSMPIFKSADPALLKRICILDFKESFEDKADPQLLEKLKKEIPGIFNWILEMADNIILEDDSIKIGEPKSILNNLEKYKYQLDTTLGYVNEKVTLKENHAVQLKEIYDSYRKWFKEQGYKSSLMKNKSLFKTSLTQHFKNLDIRIIPYLKDKSGKAHKSQIWVVGLKLNDQPNNCAELSGTLI
ncbi:MAG: DUF5906 domain-containing protein [Melioribacteraceae bacterium]|nr:DUF5906 domain-containing protein [Melioribacteraceae bacterium]